jgi:hypothetical protein
MARGAGRGRVVGMCMLKVILATYMYSTVTIYVYTNMYYDKGNGIISSAVI